jgi:outer membrane protein assembly factor BamB
VKEPPTDQTGPPTEGPTSRRPLRLWPSVIIVVLQWVVWLLVPVLMPGAAGFAILGGVAGGVLVLVWWLFFSRARWFDRFIAVVLMVGAVAVTKRLVHPSIANGMMGMMLPFSAVPLLCLALVGWATVSARHSGISRYASLVAVIVLACAVLTLMRTGGITADGDSDLHWRWTETPEQRLLARAKNTPTGPVPGPFAVVGTNSHPDWPGFRGPERDGIIRGTQIATEWSRSGPVELWRRPIGPGWSSFAVQDNVAYTQEQRGEDEIVSCYNLTTGAPVWTHRDATRFWESNAGAGPRATPTLDRGRVFTFGATGILNALDARDGHVIWSRNAASDTKRKVPGWGFSSSPLVVGDTVIIAAAGTLAAYNIGDGNPRWFGPTNGWGYSSPHLATLDGVMQILLLNGVGAVSVSPPDGKLLWDHEWKSDGMVQPRVIEGGDVLIGSGSGMGAKTGLHRIAVTHGTAGWTVKERWTTTGLKPYFNDFVVHKGHAYGFDGSSLACVDLKDGARKWKGGRYGAGQLVGFADQDLLLVLSEHGQLALVKATPEEFMEVARFAAIQGKTWNHPVLVKDVLLVRNDREMAAFRLTRVGL